MHDPSRRKRLRLRTLPRAATPEPSPARRISTIFNSAARIPRLAHPKLRTAPREGATPRGPDRGHGLGYGTEQELFKRGLSLKVSAAHTRRFDTDPILLAFDMPSHEPEARRRLEGAGFLVRDGDKPQVKRKVREGHGRERIVAILASILEY